jgi:hypothetical protein
VPTTLAPDTYYWTVVYSGDGANQPSTSPCGSEILTVQPPQPTTLSTVQVWGTTRGASITVPGSATGVHDEATLSGANASTATGTLTFRLYRRAGSGLLQCTGPPVFTSTQTLLAVFGGGTSSQPVPTTLAPDTYYWTVVYSGDGANQPSTSPCGSETLTIARPLLVSPGATSVSLNLAALGIGCTTLPCTVAVTITRPPFVRADVARDRGKSQPPVATLATGRVTIRKHGAQTVRLRLTAAGRRFVASHRGRVILTATVAITIHGHTTVVKRRLTIKIAKASNRQPH